VKEIAMLNTELRQLSVEAAVGDAIDASARLLADIGKFGLALAELHITHDSGGAGRLRMRLEAPGDLDVESVAARLARHLSVVSLVCA
jgi:predicted trehalose synthase